MKHHFNLKLFPFNEVQSFRISPDSKNSGLRKVIGALFGFYVVILKEGQAIHGNTFFMSMCL